MLIIDQITAAKRKAYLFDPRSMQKSKVGAITARLPAEIKDVIKQFNFKLIGVILGTYEILDLFALTDSKIILYFSMIL